MQTDKTHFLGHNLLAGTEYLLDSVLSWKLMSHC